MEWIFKNTDILSTKNKNKFKIPSKLARNNIKHQIEPQHLSDLFDLELNQKHFCPRMTKRTNEQLLDHPYFFSRKLKFKEHF